MGTSVVGVKESIVLSLVLTPIALVIGLLSAGAGHGDYFLGKLLFPYTMLSTVVFDSITVPFIALALVQFPIYGGILALAATRRKFRIGAILLGAIHVVAALLALLFVGTDFS